MIKKITEAAEETIFVLDTVLKSNDLEPMSEVLDRIVIQNREYSELLDQVEKLRKEVSKTTFKLPEIKVEKSGEIPEGKLTWKKACDVFKVLPKKCDFEVPFWEWEHPHPAVPEVKSNYIFRKDYLMAALYGLVSNEKTWLQGHTGSGKTTLIEQIAATLNYPFICINFDSEISRYDLVGKMDLLADGGATKTVWVDGILPQAMAGPFMACFDELDFVRPDIAYVMQRVLEGNSLRILEDGGREVHPHAMYRMFATGNTNGQGDEHGIYQGARPQSAAFLNRFTNWVNVQYMDAKQIKELIESSVPAYPKAKELSDYVSHHQEMFEKAEVVQPISPRTFISLAQKAVFYESMGITKPHEAAHRDTVLNACNSDDSKTLHGLFARFF